MTSEKTKLTPTDEQRKNAVVYLQKAIGCAGLDIPSAAAIDLLGHVKVLIHDNASQQAKIERLNEEKASDLRQWATMQAENLALRKYVADHQGEQSKRSS